MGMEMARMGFLRSLLVRLIAVGVAGGALPPGSRAESPPPGQALYSQKCASCHAADGQGVVGNYEVPLAGARSVDELTRLIERTMPEGEPENCVGDEARQVAAYIYDAFYSPTARQRLGLDPVQKVELMRLTVPQYRNAVADLIGRFTPDPAETRQLLAEREPSRRRRRPEGRRANRDGSNRDGSNRDGANSASDAVEAGLRGSYYSSKGMSKADSLSFERIDGRMEFDFQEGAPAEGIPTDQFAIVWEGALAARTTGEYLFRITTPNGARLYLNDDPTSGLRKLRDDSSAAGQSALVDAWVSSKQLREVSASISLLGGRLYPLRLEFFKYQEPTASLKVEWKPPHGAWSVLDQYDLTTADVSRTFVLETAFPADDRSLGYERGSSISHEWQVAAANAAVRVADEVVDRLDLLSGELSVAPSDQEPRSDADSDSRSDSSSDSPSTESSEDAANRQQRLQDFVVRFAEVAFRQPLTAEQQARLRELPFAGESSPEAAVRRAIVWILCSPGFVYADLTPPDASPSQDAIAARLALTLWDSLPDAELAAAAEAGELASAEQVEAQARRMLRDGRARAKMRGFFQHWLELEERDLSKDEQMFPDFDEHVIADLRKSLELFLEDVVWSEASDYRELLSADYLLLNDRLVQMYTPPNPPGSADQAEASTVADLLSPAGEFRRMTFAGQVRAGVLTHPYLLSAFAYHDNTSPIHRGVFLTRNVVGRALKPPPVAVAFKNDEFAPDLTMREKVTQLTRDANCMACHSVINPLGFALENYDAVGRWRTSESEKALDTRSQYTTENGETVEVDSARDISELALSSESAHRSFVVQLVQHLTKQSPGAYGPATVERMRAAFEADQFNIQNLMVRIAVLAATHGSSTSPIPAANSPQFEEASL